METPYKVIHVVKNALRKRQYHMYIFLGSLVSPQVKKILDKIRDLDLFETWSKLSLSETQSLQESYGEFWYHSFYHSDHIESIVNSIIQDPTRSKLLSGRYGKDWVKKHILETTRTSDDESGVIAYGLHVKKTNERRMVRKLNKLRKLEELDDYTLQSRVISHSIWGDQNKPYKILQDTDTCAQESEQMGGAEVEEEEEDPYANLDQLRKEAKKDTREIQKIISTDKKSDSLYPFPTQDNDNYVDGDLRNLYRKHYIYSHCVYSDDTIIRVKHKICDSLANNPSLGPNNYFIPPYTLLWCSYDNKGSREDVMMGGKWLIQNSLLQVDTIPTSSLKKYENLDPPLDRLQYTIKRPNYIKYEDNLIQIVHDYHNYQTMNEIYFLDVMNELGAGYSPSKDAQRNLTSVYAKIYFPQMSSQDFRSVIEYLSGDKDQVESLGTFMTSVNDTIHRDLLLEKEVIENVERVKSYGEKEYGKYVDRENITQIFIRDYLDENYEKIDLYHIFDNFVTSDKYPFLQYQQRDGTYVFKLNEGSLLDMDNQSVLKWIDNQSQGITIKIAIGEAETRRYVSVIINNTGRIDWKVQWRESDSVSLDKAKETYKIIADMIDKIHAENPNQNIKLTKPSPKTFQIAFVNFIMHFHLPNNYIINHNEMSDFMRYFYVYISPQIDPNQKNNADGASKYGSYSKYKRISNYDLMSRIEKAIIFYIRNTHFTESELTDTIARHFSITTKFAQQILSRTRSKYPKLKQSRKNLKSFSEMKRGKPPGVEMDIQGKTPDRYIIRVEGAHDEYQLTKIKQFANVLIYYYVQVFVLKNPKYQKILERLTKLTNIAKRVSMVREVVNYDSVKHTTKQKLALDASRIGKGDDEDIQWSRACQQSGDQKRQPLHFASEEELLGKGFKITKATKKVPYEHYARTTKYKGKDVTTRAIKLEVGSTGRHVFYACTPENNAKHMHIGFLTKSKRSNGLVAPCCFIKDPLTSANKMKRDLYLQNVGAKEKIESDPNTVTGDQLYILQDNKKLPPHRLAYLPKSLDILANMVVGNEIKITKNHLDSAKNYFLKYGSESSNQPFLTALSPIINVETEAMMQLIKSTLSSDKDDRIFSGMNDGKIRLQYSRKDYLEQLDEGRVISHRDISNILAIPGLVTPSGVLIIFFQMESQVIESNLEKNRTIRRYYPICYYSGIPEKSLKKMDVVLMIISEKKYYPIVSVTKTNSTEINLQKTFKYVNDEKNIVHRINKFYEESCQDKMYELVGDTSSLQPSAEKCLEILKKIGKKVNGQVLDSYYHTNYLSTPDGKVPCYPSTALAELPVVTDKPESFRQVLKNLLQLHSLSPDLNCKPMGIYYHQKDGKNMVNAVFTASSGIIVVDPTEVNLTEVKKNGLLVVQNSLENSIDNLISLHHQGHNFPDDERSIQVHNHMVEREWYQLFRYHLAWYLKNNPRGQKLHANITKVTNSKFSKNSMLDQLRVLLLSEIDNGLLTRYQNLVANNPQTGGGDMAVTVDAMSAPNSKATIDNNRKICYTNNKTSCGNIDYCHWDGVCKMGLTQLLVAKFVNKVAAELIQGGINHDELMGERGYDVPSVVNYRIFQIKKGERVFLLNDYRLKNIIHDLLGPQNLRKVSYNLLSKISDPLHEELAQMNPIKVYGDWNIQAIYSESDMHYRAFANVMYWKVMNHRDLAHRNLGYYDTNQTKLAKVYKSLVTTHMHEDPKFFDPLKNFNPFSEIEEYAEISQNTDRTLSNGVIEYASLSHILGVSVVMYSSSYRPDYLIRGNQVTQQPTNNLDESLEIRFTRNDKTDVASSVAAMYRIEK